MAAGSHSFTIDFPLTECLAAIERLQPDFGVRPYTVVWERARLRALREAQRLAPVGHSVSPDTQRLVRGGGLKAALTANTDSHAQTAVVRVGVMGPKAAAHPYAAIAEFGGTVPVRRPVRKRWMRWVSYDKAAIASAKTTKKGSRKAIPITGEHFRKHVQGFYRPPHPYLTPALNKAGEAAVVDLGKTLDAQWRKRGLK